MSITQTNTAEELTIVIPAKNEAKLIPRLLNALANQDYPKMRNTRILVADAGSTDGTQDIVLSFRDRLNVEVIPGGLPSVARNAGARRAATEFILFIDADVEPASNSLIRRAMELAESRKLHCLTTDIICREGSWLDKFLYLGNDLFQHLSRIHHPFSTGMFMLFNTQRFRELGGFHEGVHFAEDYLLSKQVARSKFRIVRGGVYTTNRRFQKMGHFRVAKLFLTTALNYWNEKHFLRDHKYWESDTVSSANPRNESLPQ
jgi:glycosyltransferase involved in cell wall biosynthesis